MSAAKETRRSDCALSLAHVRTLEHALSDVKVRWGARVWGRS